jgi:hypothetical protein
MLKILGIVLLLAAMLALISASRPEASTPAGFTTPQIVAQTHFTGTESTATRTLFSVSTTGLYRISAYLSMNVTGTSGCSWNYELSWTDDAGAEGPQQIMQASDERKPPDDYAFGPTAGYQQTLIVRAVAGSDITYDVNDTGCHAGGTYELSATAERIQ